LLRTLATILAQRLRQVDPQFYGLGAYGVVDTPGLPPAPEAAEEIETTELSLSESAPLGSVVSKYGAVPDDEEEAPPGLSAPRKRVRTGTMPLPDPDELEPL
jgi:hypothetical protein